MSDNLPEKWGKPSHIIDLDSLLKLASNDPNNDPTAPGGVIKGQLISRFCAIPTSCSTDKHGNLNFSFSVADRFKYAAIPITDETGKMLVVEVSVLDWNEIDVQGMGGSSWAHDLGSMEDGAGSGRKVSGLSSFIFESDGE